MGYEIACSSVSMAEPLSYAEAMRRPDAEQWKKAALEELNAHSTNGTWKLIPRPELPALISLRVANEYTFLHV